jgi:hypothetical protein
MRDWLPSFVEELTKLSTEDLPADARAKQYLQFGALGAGAGPIMGGLGNLIARGKFITPGVSPKRWLASQMVTGSMIGGALPVLRDILHRGNVEQVQQGHQAEKLLKAMAPEGPDKALKKLQRRASVLEL